MKDESLLLARTLHSKLPSDAEIEELLLTQKSIKIKPVIKLIPRYINVRDIQERERRIRKTLTSRCSDAVNIIQVDILKYVTLATEDKQAKHIEDILSTYCSPISNMIFDAQDNSGCYLIHKYLTDSKGTKGTVEERLIFIMNSRASFQRKYAVISQAPDFIQEKFLSIPEAKFKGGWIKFLAQIKSKIHQNKESSQSNVEPKGTKRTSEVLSLNIPNTKKPRPFIAKKTQNVKLEQEKIRSNHLSLFFNSEEKSDHASQALPLPNTVSPPDPKPCVRPEDILDNHTYPNMNMKFELHIPQCVPVSPVLLSIASTYNLTIPNPHQNPNMDMKFDNGRLRYELPMPRFFSTEHSQQQSRQQFPDPEQVELNRADIIMPDSIIYENTVPIHNSLGTNESLIEKPIDYSASPTSSLTMNGLFARTQENRSQDIPDQFPDAQDILDEINKREEYIVQSFLKST